MWQAAGSEPSVAPHVLKTILLILKGKPGEIQDNLMDRRRFSLDAANMMPVAVNNTSVPFPGDFLLMNIPIYPLALSYFLGSVLLSFIHSSHTHLLSAYSVPVPVHEDPTLTMNQNICHRPGDRKLRKDTKCCGEKKVTGRV